MRLIYNPKDVKDFAPFCDVTVRYGRDILVIWKSGFDVDMRLKLIDVSVALSTIRDSTRLKELLPRCFDLVDGTTLDLVLDHLNTLKDVSLTSKFLEILVIKAKTTWSKCSTLTKLLDLFTCVDYAIIQDAVTSLINIMDTSSIHRMIQVLKEMHFKTPFPIRLLQRLSKLQFDDPHKSVPGNIGRFINSIQRLEWADIEEVIAVIVNKFNTLHIYKFIKELLKHKDYASNSALSVLLLERLSKLDQNKSTGSDRNNDRWSMNSRVVCNNGNSENWTDLLRFIQILEWPKIRDFVVVLTEKWDQSIIDILTKKLLVDKDIQNSASMQCFHPIVKKYIQVLEKVHIFDTIF